MKRDIDLIRGILFAVEKSEGRDALGLAWQKIDAKDHSKEEIIFHLNLLREAGFLKFVPTVQDSDKDNPNPIIKRLTWAGYEFLEAAREDTNWKAAKEVAGKVGSFSLEVLKPILIDLAKQAALTAVVTVPLLLQR